MVPKCFPQIVELPDSLPDPIVEFVEQALAAAHVTRTLKCGERLVRLLERESQGSEPKEAAQPRKHRYVDQPIIALGAVGGLDQSLAFELPNQRRRHLVAERPQLGSGLADGKPRPAAARGTEQEKRIAFPVRHIVRRTTCVLTGANGS